MLIQPMTTKSVIMILLLCQTSRNRNSNNNNNHCRIMYTNPIYTAFLLLHSCFRLQLKKKVKVTKYISHHPPCYSSRSSSCNIILTITHSHSHIRNIFHLLLSQA